MRLTYLAVVVTLGAALSAGCGTGDGTGGGGPTLPATTAPSATQPSPDASSSATPSGVVLPSDAPKTPTDVDQTGAMP